MNLERQEILFGKSGNEKLRNSSVYIFGIGGVGSFAAEAIARSGIGKITLIDKDTISSSNVNRQIHSASSTIGQYKTDAMKKRILDINPEADVMCFPEFCNVDNAADFFVRPCDYIIDAVDTVTAKLAVVSYAKENGIPVISCMSAGNKLDPSLFTVSDIYSTTVCPLCRVMRRELKKRNIDSLTCVYSTEKSRVSHTKETIGSVSFVPSVMGLIAAGTVIRHLAGDIDIRE